ncbi:MAG: DUF1735 domain-containing protein [Bacteroidia bacterium]|nr:DUF1735 domain-containing protein [Bacteroidia bacterium]
MKKLLAFIILSIAMVSCYDNYIYDFTYTGIYFPYQMDVRTFVVGEGMKFEVGAALGGVRENTINRNVSFILDNALITPARLALMKAASQPYIKNPATPVVTLLQLPANYYTISNPTTMVIKTGQHSGTVTIKPDSVAFLNDSLKTMYSTYALPFRITAADADSMPYLKRTNIVGVRFENMLFGNYWHGGAALVNRPGKVDTTMIYRWAVNDIASKIWTLTTFGPNTLVTNGYFSQTTTKTELKLVLKGNKVYVSTAAGSTYTYVPDAVGTFNRAKLIQDRKIFLKYTYTVPGVGGFTYHCTDTLIFRNRLRDGINEWQDENPSHYTK